MSSSVLIAVLLAAILFVIYLRVSGLYQATEPFVSEKILEMPESVAEREPPAAPAPVEPPQQRRLPEPQDSDPYDDTHGDSDVKDNLRRPERLFGPTTAPDDTDTAVSSGVASSVTNTGFSTFSPEFAQNGGEFIPGGIFANDAFEDQNFSAI
jgi:outer membrane biosynthesis protein TonB